MSPASSFTFFVPAPYDTRAACTIALSAVCPSATKPNAVRAPLSLFADSAALGAPRVAIGGITPANAGEIVAAGADMLAVIGGVFDAEDPLAAACALSAGWR